MLRKFMENERVLWELRIWKLDNYGFKADNLGQNQIPSTCSDHWKRPAAEVPVVPMPKLTQCSQYPIPQRLE